MAAPTRTILLGGGQRNAAHEETQRRRSETPAVKLSHRRDAPGHLGPPPRGLYILTPGFHFTAVNTHNSTINTQQSHSSPRFGGNILRYGLRAQIGHDPPDRGIGQNPSVGGHPTRSARVDRLKQVTVAAAVPPTPVDQARPNETNSPASVTLAAIHRGKETLTNFHSVGV